MNARNTIYNTRDSRLRGNVKIFIIAGEVSGDVLGAKIMSALPDADFVGIGGENMRNAGLRSLFPISDLSVMGFIEVLANARTLIRRINQTADAIIRSRPDIVLTIDSPSFAKRVIKKVKKSLEFRVESRDNNADNNLNSKLVTKHSPLFYHVVAPQVWAWGAKRAKQYAEIFDALYAFFDFEKPYFEKYGLKTIAVGHPIADIPLRWRRDGAKRRGSGNKTIALIPGSRMSEVKKLLPLFHSVINCLTTNETHQNMWMGYKFENTKPIPVTGALNRPKYDGKNFDFVIPTTETTDEYIRNEIQGWAIKPKLVAFKDRYEIFAQTDIAIAASGTVTAELAIMHIPAIVVYKMNPITEFLARIILKIKWVSLVNILMNKCVYPELLGRDATPQNIICEIGKLQNADVRGKMISELKSADKLWRKPGKSPAELIADNLFNV